MFHELPRLAAQYNGDLSFTALKGYDHYPCLRKLERLSRSSSEIKTDKRPGGYSHGNCGYLCLCLPISRWGP